MKTMFPYRRHLSMNRYFCYYCGIPATGVDHVPPLSWVDCIGTGQFMGKEVKLYRVRSCIECNYTLGDQPLFTPKQRKSHIASRRATRPV